MGDDASLLAELAYPVILSGGSGTRLWPVSRKDRPKQFIPLISEFSMMQETLRRVQGIASFGAPIIVANHSHAQLVQEQLAGLAVQSAAILMEPMARNTAAAVAIAAEWIVRNQGDGLMLVMPSDHVISNVEEFHRLIYRAMPAAKEGYLMTFGIRPTHAETGFGYIEVGGVLHHESVNTVTCFHEKPAIERAEEYVAAGNYLWNAGIFLFRASAILDALRQHAPGVALASANAVDAAIHDGSVVRPDEASFALAPDISIDNAVMEKAERVAVVAADIGWSDVGSWDALWAIRDQDEDMNSRRGLVVDIDSRGNLLYADGGPPIATIGLENMLVISTAEGVLVAPRSRSQDIKKIVELMNRTKPS